MASRRTAPLNIRLLGHIALESNGSTFALASQRSTAPLLAYLLLHRDAPVAREYLAYLLSPDDPEESARLKLRNNLYRLTKALPSPSGVEWILADQENVRWNPEAPVWLDIAEFERASRDPSRLEEAVALYRGELLTTFYDEWLIEPRERYRNLYVASLTELVSQLRRDRNLTRALGYAQQLLAADPFREDVVRRLIAIHHESGDRAGALRQYQQFDRRLHDELGIEPMPETIALRDAIARDEPVALSVEPQPAAVAPSSERELPFVGRQAELDQLFDSLGRAARSRGGCVFLTGEAGIGKSRLALEFGRMAEERGARVLTGSTGAPEELPYQSLIEAVRSAMPQLSALKLSDVWQASLATILPELREHATAHAPLPRVDPSEERQRLFEALARCLSALAKPRPLIVVLEDLHWAGEATFAAVEYLLRRVLLLPILFVVTYRDDETPRGHPLRRLRRAAQAEGLIRGLTLAPLTRTDVTDLGRHIPSIGTRLGALYAASDGNPLFLTQLVDVPLDALSSSGAAGLRHVVVERLEHLSAEARTVAEIAALIGTRFSGDAVVEVSGWQESAVRGALDELIDHRIVKEAGGGGFFDYAFVHGLVAEIVAVTTAPDRAAARHRRIARVLEELGADRTDELAATVARQYELAGDAAAAVPRYLSAARRALGVGAVDEAEALAARGLGLASDPELRFELLLVSETAAGRSGADDVRMRVLDELDALARSLREKERQQTVALRRIEFAVEANDRDGEIGAIETLRRLTDANGDLKWTGRLRDAESRLATSLGKLEEALAAANAALAAYRAAGDVRGEAQARIQIAEIATNRGDLANAESLLDAAREAAERASDASLTFRLLRMWFQYAYARRDLARCVDVSQRCLEAALASGDRRAEADAHERLAISLIHSGGHYADARRHLDETVAIGREVDDEREVSRRLPRRGQLYEAVGDFAAAERAHEQYFENFADDLEPRQRIVALINLAGARARSGRGEEAATLSREALTLARDAGYAVLEASATEALAFGEAASGEYRAAIERMETALSMRAKTNSADWSGVTLANLALWYANLGDLDGARTSITRMLEAEDTIASATPWPQTCYWAAAQVFHLCGDDAAAQRALDRAQTLMRSALERVDEGDRDMFLAIPWHQDLIAAGERDEWPNPLR